MGALPWIMIAILWVPLAFAGGLGFAPLLFLASVFLLFQDKALQLRPYMVAISGFLGFAALSSIWSPWSTPLVEVDFARNAYAVKASAIRVGLVALLAAIVIAAARKADAAHARRAGYWLSGAIILQLIVLIVIAHFEGPLLNYLSFIMSDAGEGVQNNGRNAVILAICLPCLLAGLIYGGWLKGWRGHLLAAVLASIAVVHFVLLDSLAGSMAVIAAYALMYLPLLIRRGIFRVLGFLTAVYVLAAPLVYYALGAGLSGVRDKLPLSTVWRLEAWALALEKVREKPVFGWGLDSMRVMRDKFLSGPLEGQLIIPNHPHNMLLHLWGELGAVGAGIAAIAILLLAWRLPSQSRLGLTVTAAICGLWGATVIICSFSFSLWNEWWWAVVSIVAAFIILMSRVARQDVE